jgi:hypothetical protein
MRWCGYSRKRAFAFNASFLGQGAEIGGLGAPNTRLARATGKPSLIARGFRLLGRADAVVRGYSAVITPAVRPFAGKKPEFHSAGIADARAIAPASRLLRTSQPNRSISPSTTTDPTAAIGSPIGWPVCTRATPKVSTTVALIQIHTWTSAVRVRSITVEVIEEAKKEQRHPSQ